MLTRGFCKAWSNAPSPGSKKLMPLTVFSSTLRGLVRRSRARTAGGEVVQGREVSKIAPVAAEQDLAQVDQAVDAFLDGSQFAGWRPLPVFHLAVVPEKRHVIGGGLDAQHDAAFVRTS
jgi:hypothetical protein